MALPFKALERASLAQLCNEADRLSVSKEGTRFQILIRVAAKQCPDLVQPDSPHSAPLQCQPSDASTGLPELPKLHFGSADSDVQAKVDARVAQTDAVAQNGLRNQRPQLFSSWLKQQVMDELSTCASPQKPKEKLRNARAPVWEHFTLHGGDSTHVYCLKCCPPDVDESSWNLKGKLRRNKSQATTNMLTHLELQHGICLRKREADLQGNTDLALASYPQDQLRKYYKAMSMAAAVDLLPMTVWEKPAMRQVVKMLNPRVPPRARKTVRRTIDEIFMEHETRLRDFVQKQLRGSLPYVCLEHDMWPSPNHGHFLGTWLHGITAEWKPASLLVHCAPFGPVSHATANQAQRIRAAVRSAVDMEVSDLAFLATSDNAPDAAGVSRLLNLENGRCSAHIIALAASHLNWHTKRGGNVVVHERAMPAVFELLEKVRNLAKLFLRRYGNESNANAGLLEATMKRLDEPVLVVILDRASKWSSTYYSYMIARMLRIQRSMLDVAVQAGHRMPHGTFLGEPEYLLLGDVAGVLRPLEEATNIIQTDDVVGSAFLPVLHALQRELAEDALVHVRAGDAAYKELMPLAESDIRPAAREYRAALRAGCDLVLRHVEPCREAMELAALCDPRFRRMPWTTTSSERLEIRRRFTEKVLDAALRTAESLVCQPEQALVPTGNASRPALGGKRREAPIGTQQFRQSEHLRTGTE